MNGTITDDMTMVDITMSDAATTGGTTNDGTTNDGTRSDTSTNYMATINDKTVIFIVVAITMVGLGYLVYIGVSNVINLQPLCRLCAPGNHELNGGSATSCAEKTVNWTLVYQGLAMRWCTLVVLLSIQIFVAVSLIAMVSHTT
ncbi:hypothetical protein O1611_g4408 [Lasiodiplodia mahajangana]|uniref:Uncharacterized protein n=1 Tax=Lasiodiplodia mahajangana TaxID=1108764 RepID=A0ACC2JPQ9_9PEZI|nr:hypothetical protein O1611_g4408 [Lasiodiplodia mahajangana]